jgi:nitrogenase molybdenum-cofactor synthesis protein NifE
MLNYDCSEAHADVTIGKDAGYYHPGCPNLQWNEDVQPFGYAGLRKLLDELSRVLSEKERAV